MSRKIRTFAVAGALAAGILAVSAPAASATTKEGPYFYGQESECYYVGNWSVNFEGYSGFECDKAPGGWNLYIWK